MTMNNLIQLLALISRLTFVIIIIISVFTNISTRNIISLLEWSIAMNLGFLVVTFLINLFDDSKGLFADTLIYLFYVFVIVVLFIWAVILDFQTAPFFAT